MRRILEVLSAANHPVGIVTKSALVLRDLDILTSMAERGLVKVALSVTTLDRKLARAMEPRASTPDKRLETLRAAGRGRRAGLGDGGAGHSRPDRHGDGAHPGARGRGRRVPGGLCAAAGCRSRSAICSPNGCKRNCPDRANRVLSLMRSTRGGKLYEAKWGERMTGEGPYAWMIGRRFELAAERLGLNERRSSCAPICSRRRSWPASSSACSSEKPTTSLRPE